MELLVQYGWGGAKRRSPQTPLSATLKQQLDRLVIKPVSRLEHDPESVDIVLVDPFDGSESISAKATVHPSRRSYHITPLFLKLSTISRPSSPFSSLPLQRNLRTTALYDITSLSSPATSWFYLHAAIWIPKEKCQDSLYGKGPELLAGAVAELFIYAATSLTSRERRQPSTAA